MMRILLINSEYPPLGGGAGNASANLARAFVEGGHDVSVLTAQFKGLPRDELRDGVRIRRTLALRKSVYKSGALEQLSFIFGGSLGALPFVFSWRPDVVLAFFGMPSGMIALLLKVLYRIPYVVSLRGGDVPGFRPYDFATYHRLIGPFLRVVWRNAGGVVANSIGLRDLGQAFDPKTPIDIIPNGVDAERFVPAPRSWDPPRMLFVGRVVYQKGLDVLFRALGQLQSLPWELSIIGDGTQAERLRAMADEMDMMERLHLLGWQHNDDLVHQYQRANLFVYPSRHEGMPNAVLEAMATGLPVLATRIAGNEELVVPGETGVLVPSEDQDALEKALSDLIPDSQGREVMGGRARKRVEESYTWTEMAKRYEGLLAQVMD
jgi:glycosyltransferase involved in cell wall biosynthesis